MLAHVVILFSSLQTPLNVPKWLEPNISSNFSLYGVNFSESLLVLPEGTGWFEGILQEIYFEDDLKFRKFHLLYSHRECVSVSVILLEACVGKSSNMCSLRMKTEYAVCWLRQQCVTSTPSASDSNWVTDTFQRWERISEVVGGLQRKKLVKCVECPCLI